MILVMLQDHLKRLNKTQADLARGIRLDPADLNRKIHLKRRWYKDECDAVLAFLLPLDPSLTLETLFPLEPLPPSPDVCKLSDKPVDAGRGEPQLAEVGR